MRVESALGDKVTEEVRRIDEVDERIGRVELVASRVEVERTLVDGRAR